MFGNPFTEFVVVLTFFVYLARLTTGPGDFYGYELKYANHYDSRIDLQHFEFRHPEMWKFTPQQGDSGFVEFSWMPVSRRAFYFPENIGLLSGMLFSDFIMELDYKPVFQGENGGDVCIVFNFQNPEQYYYLHLASDDGAYTHDIFLVDRGNRIPISRMSTDGIQWQTRQWNRIRLERSLTFGTIYVYVNDMKNPIMMAEDNTYGHGFIGFGAFQNPGKIDNLEIRAPRMMRTQMSFFRTKTAGE